MIKTIGSSSSSNEISRLVGEGNKWIQEQLGSQELDFTDYRKQTELVLAGVEQILVQGPNVLLGRIFDDIGFGSIKEPLFRQLVLARLCYPASKLKTTDYLSKYHFIEVDIQVVYRYLDKLYNHQKERVQKISYDHTLKILDNQISVVFYDVTTIYFEAEKEDDLRKAGFSKDGKHQHPQIVLGLLVSRGGYPLAYDIFKGNQFEGQTMLPIIDAFKIKYNLSKLVVVADAGLLSKDNIAQLERGHYDYILGARLKAESNTVKQQILDLVLANGECSTIQKDAQTKLVISYSHARARKDAYNRERGIQKLDKQIRTGKLTKANINNRGYNKFLHIDNQVSISIDTTKIEQDQKWDGLKGYQTNTNLSNDEVIAHYSDLWQIEKAFRIAKSELEIRPIYHRVQRRIEAHICIAFTAYKVYKELERQLKEKQSHLSVDKAIDLAKTIYAIKIRHPVTQEITFKTIITTDEQRSLVSLFQF